MEEKMITPFSCGTDAMCWQDSNCDQCKRAYKPMKGEDIYPDFEETRSLVKRGRECELKFHVDYGFIIGEIPERIARQIGFDGHNLNESCMFFKDDDGRGWINPDEFKPIDPIPSNQLCFPFIMDELLQSGEEERSHVLQTSNGL